MKHDLATVTFTLPNGVQVSAKLNFSTGDEESPMTEQLCQDSLMLVYDALKASGAEMYNELTGLGDHS